MSIRRIWIISVANRSVLYTRAFPIIEQNARSKGFSPCLSFSSSSDEEDFVSSLFSTLGLENPFVRRNSLTTDSLGFYSIESNEKFKSEYDCSTENQLPVVSVTFKAVDLWPVIVIESNGILFCALPLIQSDSKELLDHISVSTSFCALQNFVTNFNKDNKLTSLEEYVNSMMPFGTFLGHSLGSYVEPPITRKGEDFVISVKVFEKIARGDLESEVIYGSVTIENNLSISEKGRLNINLRNLDNLSIVLSPQCSRVAEDRIRVLLTDSRMVKEISYKFENSNTNFINYEYSVSKVQANGFKIELTLNCSPAVKFAHFDVQFKRLADGSNTVTNSNMTWGQLHLRKNVGMFWILGSKLAKNGQVRLSLDVSVSGNNEFTETICNFKADNYSHKLRLTKESISVNEYLIPSPRLIIDQQLASTDYRLIPTFG